MIEMTPKQIIEMMQMFGNSGLPAGTQGSQTASTQNPIQVIQQMYDLQLEKQRLEAEVARYKPAFDLTNQAAKLYGLDFDRYVSQMTPELKNMEEQLGGMTLGQ